MTPFRLQQGNTVGKRIPGDTMRGLAVSVASVLLLAFAVTAPACGGDGDSLTLEQYFEQVAAFDTRATDDLDALELEYPDAFDDADQTQRFLDLGAEAIRDRLAGLEETEPPMEVEGAHSAYVDGAAELADAFQDYADQLASESPPEMAEVLGGLQQAGEPLTAACSALQAIADGAGIEVDLNC
jgi:hypothetical protein